MFILNTFLAAILAAAVNAQSKGFNYGATNSDGSTKVYWHFHDEFVAAQNLVGAPGFTSARLYTSIQGGSQNSPIEAIKAAIDTQTSLLLGIWASAGQDHVNQEIAAIQQAVDMWGSSFTSLVVGISVGSEDLYRISPTGIINKSDPGAEPSVIAGYINQVRAALGGKIGKPIGHVDTWTAWVNGSNSAVTAASDFLGFGTLIATVILLLFAKRASRQTCTSAYSWLP
jgi:glucan endo-1,3-beta-D-glucosidase